MNILYILGIVICFFVFIFLSGIFSSIPKNFDEKRKNVPGFNE